MKRTYPFNDEHDDDPDAGEEGICTDCGEPCHAVRIDVGIGPYEYWGATGVHHDWRWLSPCCEAEMAPASDE